MRRRLTVSHNAVYVVDRKLLLISGVIILSSGTFLLSHCCWRFGGREKIPCTTTDSVLLLLLHM